MVHSRKKWMRRLIAHYVVYLEVFGYLFVTAVAVTIALLFFFKVDDVSQAYSNPLIKPNQVTVSHEADVVVMAVLVRNHDEVAKGQPLAEICDDPAWVRRYQTAEHVDSLAAALDRTAARRDLTPDEATLREALQKASGHWEERRARMPRVILRAPATGVVEVGEGLVGKVFASGKEIAGILDFDDLRITSDLRGANLAGARVGNPIKVEALMIYGNGEILRSDFEREGRWEWKRPHGQYNSLLHGKLMETLQDHFKGRLATLEEDTLFAVKKVTEVEIQGSFAASDGGAGRPEIHPEPFGDVVIRGHVIEGTHTASIRFRDLPDTLRSRLETQVLEHLKEHAVRSLEGSTLAVNGIKNLEIAVKMDADDKGVEKALGKWTEPLMMERVERKFLFEAKIDNPSAALKAKVRELALAETASYIKTKTEVVVGQRRIAMLLFRKD